MASVNTPTSAPLESRMPSTQPIDKRWDRSRSAILRNAERNALRDFRWTYNDPITFSEIPATSRTYARKEITRRSGQDLVGSQGDGSGPVDPGAVFISREDRLKDDIKLKTEMLSAALREKDQLAEQVRQYQNKQTERDLDLRMRQERIEREQQILESRKASLETTIVDKESEAKLNAEASVEEDRKALQDDRMAFQEERTSFHRAIKEEGARIELKLLDLRQEKSELGKIKSDAREQAIVDAQAVYEARNAVLNKEKSDMQQEFAKIYANVAEEKELVDLGWAELEAGKAGFDSRVKDAINEAQAKVQAEHQQMIDSASWKEGKAQIQLDEAVELRNQAAQERQDVAEDLRRVSQKHKEDMAQEKQAVAKEKQKVAQDLRRVSQEHENEMALVAKKFNEMLNADKAALTYERQRAIGDLEEKLKNAAYREQIERKDYDAYREVWQEAVKTSQNFSQAQAGVAMQLRDAARAWERTARFNASEIHPSFSSKYPHLSSQIQQFLNSSSARSARAVELAESRAKMMSEDLQSSLVSDSHYSRRLTRLLRFQRSQGKGMMTRVLSEVLGEARVRQMAGQLAARKRELENELEKMLRSSQDTSGIERLRADMAEIDKNLTSITNVAVFLTTLRNDLFYEHLQEDSVYEREIWDATADVDDRIRKAAKPWSQFLGVHQGRVIDSEVDKDEQVKNRNRINKTLDSVRNGYTQLQNSVRKVSLLEEHLGEGGERIARIDAKIKARRKDSSEAVWQTLGKLAGVPRSRPRSRPFAFASDCLAARAPLEPRRRTAVASTAPKKPHSVSPANAGSSISINARSARLAHAREKPQSTRKPGNEAAYESETKKQQTAHELRRTELEKRRHNLGGSKKQRARWERHKRAAQSFKPSLSLAPSTGSAAPSPLNFKPTASQQSWHSLRFRQKSASYSHETTSKAAPRGSNMAVLSKILGAYHSDTICAPRALRVYSLHSLQPTELNEHTRAEAHDNLELHPTSTSPVMSSFAGSARLTQSSMETISDPESDDSYEPSDSGVSAAASDLPECLPEASETDPSLPLASTQDYEDALEMQPAADAVAPIEQADSQLTFNIPEEDYRRAVMASKNSNAGFWTYKLYKNSEGKTPSVHYCTNFDAAEVQAKQFLNESVIGFDLEWEVGAYPGKSSIKNCVSLVQIASEARIGLFQLAMFKGDTAERLMPPSLRRILESGKVTKTGVNISNDASRIEKCFGFRMQGIFELSHLYNVAIWSEKSPERVNKKLVKLADQVQNVLLLPLKKDAVRTSKWSQRLRPEQTEYAAADAYAGFRIYHVLEARRKKMSPTPPRPAFWEDKLPLVLGDGTVVTPRKVVKKKTDDEGKVVEEEDEEGEEYFDAVETLDPYQLDPLETDGIPLEGLSISYPALPTLEKTLNEQLRKTEDSKSGATIAESSTMIASSLEPAIPEQKPRPITLSSPAVGAAETWAQTFRNGLPTTHNLKTKQAHLRAYHLWHHQDHDCKEVASLLRDPPLSVTTVASYVMQAVAEGRELPYDKERITTVLELLPSSVRSRYWWIVERVERAEVEREVGRGYA